MDYNSSILISKVNNMMKLIYNAVSLNKLDTVIQFMSDDLYNKFKDMIDNNSNNNYRVIYDEINVSSEITGSKNFEDYTLISVRCNLKFLKYYVSLEDGNYISGDRDNRVGNILNITLKRSINHKELDGTYKCLGCGFSMNIVDGYTCPKCGRVFDLDEFDFIIDNMG